MRDSRIDRFVSNALDRLSDRENLIWRTAAELLINFIMVYMGNRADFA